MTMQKLQLSSEPVYFKVSQPTTLVLCDKLKCDSKIELSVSLNQTEWITLDPTRDRLLNLNPQLYYKATLQEGVKQVESVWLQFEGEEQKKKSSAPTKPSESTTTKKAFTPPSLNRPKNVSTPSTTKNSDKD